MPLCVATWDEIAFPLDKGELQGISGAETNLPRRSAG